MGYTTDFYGSLKFNREVTVQMKEYINRFSSTRRMPRDNAKIKEVFPNWRELCFFGELGSKGEYFAPTGQNRDDSVVDYNGYSTRVHPSLWCQWVINDDNELVWDGNEKFYNYVEWLEYLIKHFFAPLGYVLNGDIEWQGEDSEDVGVIHVNNNVVTSEQGIHACSISEVSAEKLIDELKKRGYKVIA